MAVLPFYTYLKATKKPFIRHYHGDPHTLGEHIRKARMERGLLQKDVAATLETCEDTITGWESNRSSPMVSWYPKIIAFLGYYPFNHETDSLGGKLKQIRYSYGYSVERCAALLKISVDAARRWEDGKAILNPKFRALIVTLWEQLPTNQTAAAQQLI